VALAASRSSGRPEMARRRRGLTRASRAALDAQLTHETGQITRRRFSAIVAVAVSERRFRPPTTYVATGGQFPFEFRSFGTVDVSVD
jgi:hypothetical protein